MAAFALTRSHPQAGVALQTFHLVETLIDGHAGFLAGNVHALADEVMISSGLNVCRKSFDIFFRFSIELGLLVSFCCSKARFHALLKKTRNICRPLHFTYRIHVFRQIHDSQNLPFCIPLGSSAPHREKIQAGHQSYRGDQQVAVEGLE